MPHAAACVPALDDVTAMTLDGTIGYALNAGRELVVFDLANAAAPVALAVLDLGWVVESLVLRDDTLYVRRSGSPPVNSSNLHVVDVRDPRRPKLRGSIELPGNGRGVAVSGDHAFVPMLDTLNVIDIADPTRLAVDGAFAVPDATVLTWLPALVARGDRLWLGTSEALLTLDIADPTRPRLLGSIAGPVGGIWATDESHLIVGGYGAVLYRLDDAGMPQTVAMLDALPFAPATRGWFGMAGGIGQGERFYGLLSSNMQLPGSGLIVLDLLRGAGDAGR